MPVMKQLRGPCQKCGALLSFPAGNIGNVINCPRCGQPTELMLETPPEEPTLPRRTVIWTSIAVVILALGFGGVVYALKRAQSYIKEHPQPAPTNQPAAPVP